MVVRPRRLISCIVVFAATIAQNSSRAQESIGHYVVRLRDEPVITHLSHQAIGSAQRPKLDSEEAATYRSQLLSRQNDLKTWIEGLPEASVLAQIDTVFNGLAVRLRPEDIPLLKQRPEVAEVIASMHYHKALDAAVPLLDVPQAWANPKIGGEGNAGAGVKIAVIDTGVDINHPMLQDASLFAPSGFPRFSIPTPLCNNSDQRFTNSKVIVARNYVSLLDKPDPNCDAEDRDGHGTFVSAIAAGVRVTAPLASISGVAPKAFLGSYKVFGTPGVNDQATFAAILKALDDAMKDGMNVINLSLGAPTTELPVNDPLATAVTQAIDGGVTVVIAAGNDGPGTGTISSPGTAPEAITVGAASNSRILANPLLVEASVPVPASLQQIAVLLGNGPKLSSSIGPVPLVDVSTLDTSGIACAPLPPGSLAGEMALILRGTCNFSVKIENAASAGAIAVIIYNNQLHQPPILIDVEGATQIPSGMIGNDDGVALAEIIASDEGGLQATLQAQAAAIPTPPNRMATFSAEGPSTDFGLKPDLVATGTMIYSAAQRNYPAGLQYDPSGFSVFSGTSFSTPMVSGAAALLKQAAPAFSPGQIKSALVNTASKVVTGSQGGPVSVLAQGNGLLDAAAAVSTTFVVTPVSISFGAHPPGSIFSSAATLSVTNLLTSSDTFTMTTTNSENLTVSASPSSFSLAPGASLVVVVTATSTNPLNGTIEGYVAISNQSSQKRVTIPYWGTFFHPAANPGGVVNAASLSSGPAAVVSGGLISIFGSDLASFTESAATIPLPQSLGGTNVTLSGKSVPLLFASPTQINAQVPFELASASTADLVVSLDGVSSTPLTVSLSPAAPGIFTVGQGGTGLGVILHASNSAPVTPENPARSGEFLELYATGLGAATPAVATGAAASSTPPSSTQIFPSVSIAGISAPVTFSGLAPAFVGLYQINFQLPADVPSGDQPLIVSANNVSSNPVTISIGK